MIVICNGVPKSGTHLLYKTVGLLGVPNHPQQKRLKDTKQKEFFDVNWYKDDGYSFHRHIPYSSRTSLRAVVREFGITPRFVVILRNPKNVFISRMRRRARLSRFKGFSMEELVVRYGAAVRNKPGCPEGPRRQLFWEGWLRDPKCCVVRFEELRGQSADIIKALSRINAFLNTGANIEEVKARLEGGTATWSGRNSDWQEVWTPRIEAEFRSIGGYETMRLLGYKN